MRLMLDTDTCIYIINGRPSRGFERLRACEIGDIGLSSVSLLELRYGAERSSNPSANHRALDGFTAPLEIASYDEVAAGEYGGIRSHLERRGELIGSMDLMIAAHARSLGVTLVTNNVGEFGRVPGLRLDTWT